MERDDVDKRWRPTHIRRNLWGKCDLDEERIHCPIDLTHNIQWRLNTSDDEKAAQRGFSIEQKPPLAMSVRCAGVRALALDRPVDHVREALLAPMSLGHLQSPPVSPREAVEAEGGSPCPDTRIPGFQNRLSRR